MWSAAVLEWIDDAKRRKLRTLDDVADKFEWFRPQFSRLSLDQIGQQEVDAVLALLKVERKRIVGNGAAITLPPASNATLNRYTAAVSAVLNFAVRKGWLPAAPKLAMLPEDNEVVRWITKEQAARLLAELPEHLNRMARFALATGIRKSNVTGMLWKNVDMDRRIAWVWASDAKGKRNLGVPLNSDALAVLNEVCGQHPDAVFTYLKAATKTTKLRVPITEPAGAAWAKALKRAEIDPAFRWHDLRHTWATWHVMAGTPLHVLQQLGGWRSLDMVLRYAHIAEDFAAQYAAGSVMGPTVVRAERAA
jgi:integrase